VSDEVMLHGELNVTRWYWANEIVSTWLLEKEAVALYE
jgi:hypothetical protein